jgi:acyl-CoA hydrolase
MSGALTPRPVSFSRVSLAMAATSVHANILGNVHGGEIMKLADSTAGAVAFRHSDGPAVTAAIDEHGAPRAVPGLVTETATEVRREREARIRRAHRLARKAEIDQGREA